VIRARLSGICYSSGYNPEYQADVPGFLISVPERGLSPLFAQDGRGVGIVPETEQARPGFDAEASTALFVGVRDFDDKAIATNGYSYDDPDRQNGVFTAVIPAG